MRIDKDGLSDSLILPEEPEGGSEGFVSDDVDEDDDDDVDEDDDDDVDDDDGGWVGELESVPVADARVTDSSMAAASDVKDIPSTLLSALPTDDGNAF